MYVLSVVAATAALADAHGHHSTRPARELYLECPADPTQWVTELQAPLTDG